MKNIAGNCKKVNMNHHETKEQRKRERRQNIVDRRLGLDRRRGPGIRRDYERKSAEEGEMTDEQFEFLMAIDQYKRQNNRPFPTWTEVLDVIKAVGYRKVAPAQSLNSLKEENDAKHQMQQRTAGTD
jgi:hypothetical protein